MAAVTNAPQRVHVVNYWTSSPSTFCHPRGNNPPRVARAPTYSSRSLNDRLIVRWPLFTSNVLPGATADQLFTYQPTTLRNLYRLQLPD